MLAGENVVKPGRRTRTVTVTRPSPYGNGVETCELGIDTDPLEHMAHRRQITTAQKQAGDRFKAAYEAVSGSRGMGFDTTQERVDSSGTGQAISQQAVDGMTVLQSAVAVLGKTDYAIVTAIAGQGMSVLSYAAKVAGREAKKHAREYVGERFRDALTTLAVAWGYEATERARSRAHSWSNPVEVHVPGGRTSAPYIDPRSRPKERR